MAMGPSTINALKFGLNRTKEPSSQVLRQALAAAPDRLPEFTPSMMRQRNTEKREYWEDYEQRVTAIMSVFALWPVVFYKNRISIFQKRILKQLYLDVFNPLLVKLLA